MFCGERDSACGMLAFELTSVKSLRLVLLTGYVKSVAFIAALEQVTFVLAQRMQP